MTIPLSVKVLLTYGGMFEVGLGPSRGRLCRQSYSSWSVMTIGTAATGVIC